MQLTQAEKAAICLSQLLVRETGRAAHPEVAVVAKAKVGKPMHPHVSNGKRRESAPRKIANILTQRAGTRVPTPKERVKGRRREEKEERTREGPVAHRVHQQEVTQVAIPDLTSLANRWINPPSHVGSTRAESAGKATTASTNIRVSQRQ